MILKLAVTLLLALVITESGAISVDELGLQWSHEGRIKCRKCVQILHPTEPDDGWHDNYVCTKKDHGIQWSNNGTIEGMKCVKVDEAMDGAGEHNNYLCVSNSSTWQFHFSASSMRQFHFSANDQTENMDCILMDEPNDQHWEDNYLCVSDTETTAAATTASTTTARIDAPTTAPIDAPTTARIDAPTTARIDAPTTARIDAPTTARIDAPTTARIDAPTTARIDAPTTARIDAPTTARIDAPTTAPTIDAL